VARSGVALGILLLAGLLTPLVASQATPTNPVYASIDLPPPTRIPAGGVERVEFDVIPLHANGTLLVLLEASARDSGSWHYRLEPSRVSLAVGETRTVLLILEAPLHPDPETLRLEITATAVRGDDAQTVKATFNASVVGSRLILGQWTNPLPAPLDGSWGVFVSNIVLWVLIALLSVGVLKPAVKLFTGRTKSDLDDRLLSIVAKPAFILLAGFGVKQSLEVFDLPTWAFVALDRIWSIVLIIILVYVIYRVWREIVLRAGAKLAKRTRSELDDRLLPVFEKMGGVIIIVGGVFYLVDSLGVNLTYFAAGGVLISMVVAFAAQDTLSNFFAGIHILLDRPFRVGDRIELPDQKTWGDVTDIGLRTTRILTRDNRLVIMPNSVIGNHAVVNHSFPDPLYRIQIDIGVAYGSDVEKTRKVMTDTTRKLPGVAKDRPVEALLLEFGDSALKFRLRWWIDSYVDTRRMFDRVNSAVLKALNENGIRIPFPQRVIWYGRDQAATERPAAATAQSQAESKALEAEVEAKRKKLDAEERAESDRLRQSRDE
jgi:small-conductance mechanosensitive channel